MSLETTIPFLLRAAPISLVLIIVVKFIYNRLHLQSTWRRFGIPSPAIRSFWFGNLHYQGIDLLKRSQIDSWIREFGDVFGYYDADRPVLVVNSLELIEEIFVNVRTASNFPNRVRFPMDIEPFRSSILGARDQRWRVVRKMLTPTFTAHKICQASTKDSISVSLQRTLTALRNRQNCRIVVRAPKSADQQQREPGDAPKSPQFVVDVSFLTEIFTLDVISKIAFNIDETDVYQDDSELVDMIEVFTNEIDKPIVWWCRALPFLNPIIEFIARSVDIVKMIAVFRKHLEKLIQEYHAKNVEISEEESKKTVLDFMLYQEKAGHLNKEETIGNLMVIMFAGYETTASCLSYTMFCLAQHPEVQSRLREELKNCLQLDPDEPLERLLEKVKDVKCEYLDRVIFESLRLYPPVTGFVIRQMSENFPEITIGDINKKQYRIPQNCAIEYPLWSIHHDPKHWSSPWTFNPDRENLPFPGSGIKNFAFAAFGLGQRQCIGINLAMNEIRQMIATLLIQYQIDLDPSIDYGLDVNGMLEVGAKSELCKPVKNILLQFREIQK